MFIVPIRLIAFFFAPLIPFMVKTSHHLIGLLDALIFIYLFVAIFKNRIAFKKNEIVKSVFVIVLFLSIPFSLGVSNFGTNIRHRAKILPVILMIPIYNKKERKTIRINVVRFNYGK